MPITVPPHVPPNPPACFIAVVLPRPRRQAAGTLAAVQGEARRLPEVVAAERAYRDRAEALRKVRRRFQSDALGACI